MDTKSEDTIVRQIEQNLSTSMNDNLFLTGRTYDNSSITTRKNQMADQLEKVQTIDEENQNYPLISCDYISNPAGLSRAEYIRQARESCLRQLSAVQIYSRPYDVNYMEGEDTSNEPLIQKKANVLNLFQNGTEEDGMTSKTATVPELGSYRSLIIRSICAIMLFLCIFLFDKFDVQIGNVTNTMIEEYVTGNDALTHIENFLVTWLK